MTIVTYRKALDTARRLLGAHHPFVGKILHNMAQTYKSHRRWNLAQQAETEAVKIFTESNHRLRKDAKQDLQNIIDKHNSEDNQTTYLFYSYLIKVIPPF